MEEKNVGFSFLTYREEDKTSITSHSEHLFEFGHCNGGISISAVSIANPEI